VNNLIVVFVFVLLLFCIGSVCVYIGVVVSDG